jgi:AraC family transcriptional regulator
MSAECPYCSLAKKSGELYCSRHESNMTNLQSGLFYIRAKKFEACEPHITRLSFNFNLDTTQSYFTGNREHRVSPKKYLLINEGHAFSTFANADTESRMITIAFKVGLAEKLYYNLSNGYDQLLSQPDEVTHAPLRFFEHTHMMDDFLQASLPALLQLSENNDDQSHFQEQLEGVLVHVLLRQLGIRKEIDSIKKVKASTRTEIYTRLQSGYDYIHDNFSKAISIDEVAGHACLSSFNFKRLFREFYKQSPYQLIKKLRMTRAQELLKAGLPVNHVCKEVGWEDASSFIRLFKKDLHVTPDQYRRSEL